MKNIESIAKKVLKQEAEAVANLSEGIDQSFVECVEFLLNLQGRIVVTGVGKSAIIAQKIVATLNSTGSPALFMHATDAIHGDLGMLQPSDCVLCISKSGDTPELQVLVPLLKRGGQKLLAMVSNTQSYLAQQAHFVLNAHVSHEACPLNLAPTTSTTAALALGDALAVCLLESRNFGPDDFAYYHPGGSLGKKLYLKVSDIYPNNQLPVVGPDTPIKQVISEISGKRLGITIVANTQATSNTYELKGIVTDGDVRRMLDEYDNLAGLTAKDIMTTNPITIAPDTPAVVALQTMQDRNITQLVVVTGNQAHGVVHLHDLLKEGLL
jgi:arabinose-5-phosphate isomerase